MSFRRRVSARHWQLWQGDNLSLLKHLPDNSVDSMVTDPPAGIVFMGKEWDTPGGISNYHIYDGTIGISAPRIGAHKGNLKEHFSARDVFVAGLGDVLTECYRVLKPGAHVLLWGIPRTAHWTATAIEDAGFEVRDIITHLFASGFPKSLNISKSIDKAKGLERKVLGYRRGQGHIPNDRGEWGLKSGEPVAVTQPASPEAPQWDGWGTALKPAAEFWILARKPLIGTVVENVLRYGTGALNIDGCRIRFQNEDDQKSAFPGGKLTSRKVTGGGLGCGQKEHERGEFEAQRSSGRWPANVVFSHSPQCIQTYVHQTKPKPQGLFGAAPPGFEVVKEGHEWVCAPDCAVKEADRQGDARGLHDAGSKIAPQERWKDSRKHALIGITGAKPTPAGARYGDGGKLSRYFYVAPSGQPKWVCTSDCPVKELGDQSGASKSTQGKPRAGKKGAGWGLQATGAEYDDAGTASRFFYVAKPSTAERDAGLDAFDVKSGADLTDRKEGSAGLDNPRAGTRTSRSNVHPTVKPIDLMRYLLRLVTPPDGLVIDPFAGSGTTGCAAMAEGFRFLGMERESDYVQIARARILHAARQGKKRSPSG